MHQSAPSRSGGYVRNGECVASVTSDSESQRVGSGHMWMQRQRLLTHFFTLIWLLFLAYPIVAFVQGRPPTATLADGQTWGSRFIYVIAAAAGHTSNWRYAVAAVVAITGLMTALAAVEGAGIWTAAIALAGVLVGGVVMVSAQLGRTNRALHEAREDMARLLVAEERLRFARDLHDLLGHSLSVIVLKAELGRKLAVNSPHRAAGEMPDVERVARQARADVREAVSGYREASLAA